MDENVSMSHDGTWYPPSRPKRGPPLRVFSDEWLPVPLGQPPPPPPVDDEEEDTEMDARIRARLTQNMNDPDVWRGATDHFKKTMMAHCMTNKAWKKEFGKKLLEEEKQGLAKVPLHSSPSPAAHHSPAHSAHSDSPSDFMSEAEDDDDVAGPAPTSGCLAMSNPQHAVQQPKASHHQPMARVPFMVSQTAEAPAGVLTRSDVDKFKELEI
ncbi:hypothetical protein ACKKBG_A00765 [Auxenochlorella protothecoides x Auxenochlorella symbiontica]